MRKKKWSKEYGGTAGCTLRLAEATQYTGATTMKERNEAKKDGKREIYFHDSWFTSVKSVRGMKKELGHECFGVLKTNHAGTPKDELENIMKDWPSGSHLVMECKEHGMFICAYKYSHRKKGESESVITLLIRSLFVLTQAYLFFSQVIVTLGTWDAGSTTPGEPYMAKWPDKFGNVKSRKVSRPEIIGLYFKVANLIDVHNQLRQSALALEELWLTKDPWFRISTSVYGMTITDAFLLAKYHSKSNSLVKKMSIREFALRVAYDMLKRKVDDEQRNDIIGDDLLDPDSTAAGASFGMQQQNTARPLQWHDVMEFHQFGLTAQRGTDGKPCRRACSMKADDNCETKSKGKPFTLECQNKACLAIENSSKNIHGKTTGVFVCSNYACQKAHWILIANQARASA
jgi:hypothetical protein